MNALFLNCRYLLADNQRFILPQLNCAVDLIEDLKLQIATTQRNTDAIRWYQYNILLQCSFIHNALCIFYTFRLFILIYVIIYLFYFLLISFTACLYCMFIQTCILFEAVIYPSQILTWYVKGNLLSFLIRNLPEIVAALTLFLLCSEQSMPLSCSQKNKSNE